MFATSHKSDPSLSHPERLAYGGKLVCKRLPRRHQIAGILAILAAMLHLTEHGLLYAESVSAGKQLFEILAVVRRA